MNHAEVIPCKNGQWRVVSMTPARFAWWQRSWMAWWGRKGNRLSISPEMWVKA